MSDNHEDELTAEMEAELAAEADGRPEPPPPEDDDAPAGQGATGRIRHLICGVGPGSLTAIDTLLRQHLKLLLGSDAPLRLNGLTNDIEHDGGAYDLGDLVTRLRLAVEAKVCFETQKVDKTGKPIKAALKLPPEDTAAIVVQVARENRYSPVREWLESLPRAEPGAIRLAATEALGITDELSLLVWRKWLIGCVARVMEPGCQLDTVLTLVAPRGGERKSSMFRALVGPWFSDTHLDMVGYKRENAYMQLHRVWVYEVPELEAARSKADRSRIKSFISSRSDDFRAPYDAKVNAHPRAVALGATTNDLGFMASDDSAFNRRFWPIRIIGTIDTEIIEKLRDQVWAEALAAYRAHEPWHITPDQEAMVVALAERHDEFTEEDVWTPLVKEYVEAPARIGEPLVLIEIMRGALSTDASHLTDASRFTPYDQHRVGAILGRLDFVQVRARWTEEEKASDRKSTRWVYRPAESKCPVTSDSDPGDP